MERKIDPDSSVYGVPFDSTEEQVRAAFGAPRGVIIVSDNYKIYIYGKAHFLVFRKGKFVELNLDRHSFLRYEVARRMERHPFFDSDRLEVGPGLRFGMTFDKVVKALKRSDLEPDYQITVDGENSTMTLSFSSTYGKSGASAYTLNGFSIKYLGN